MNTWILQSGFPVVTVIRDYEKQKITMTQEKFVYENALVNVTTPIVHKSTWIIPITYTTQKEINFNETRPSHWMRNSNSIDVKNVTAGSLDWVIVNIQQTG